jgi:hypothetical protein
VDGRENAAVLFFLWGVNVMAAESNVAPSTKVRFGTVWRFANEHVGIRIPQRKRSSSGLKGDFGFPPEHYTLVTSDDEIADRVGIARCANGTSKPGRCTRRFEFSVSNSCIESFPQGLTTYFCLREGRRWLILQNFQSSSRGPYDLNTIAKRRLRDTLALLHIDQDELSYLMELFVSPKSSIDIFHALVQRLLEAITNELSEEDWENLLTANHAFDSAIDRRVRACGWPRSAKRMVGADLLHERITDDYEYHDCRTVKDAIQNVLQATKSPLAGVSTVLAFCGHFLEEESNTPREESRQ